MKCCFIGHRRVEISENLIQKLKNVIKDLIINHQVSEFSFGSRSIFDELCHMVVTELKSEYPKIKRMSYTCKSEFCILESEKNRWERICGSYQKNGVGFLCFEEEVKFKTKFTAGRLSYVERNQAMINDSDYCVFYYDKNYEPQLRKISKRSVNFYQPKSGTKIAYEYAKLKKKKIINICVK